MPDTNQVFCDYLWVNMNEWSQFLKVPGADTDFMESEIYAIGDPLKENELTYK